MIRRELRVAQPGNYHEIAVRFLLCLLVFLIFLPPEGCTSGEEGPEARLRRLFKDTERAAEEKDLRALKPFISDRYADAQGYDKEAVLSLLRYHFLRNESIHLLTRISSLNMPEPDTAEAVVLAAMAGEPISSVDDPANIGSFFYLHITPEFSCAPKML